MKRNTIMKTIAVIAALAARGTIAACLAFFIAAGCRDADDRSGRTATDSASHASDGAGMGRGDGADGKGTGGERRGVYYVCPMHPSVISDKPGACPVCGMALVKKSGGAAAPAPGADDGMPAGVSLSATQRVMADVATALVERRSLPHEIDVVGIVDYAEPLQVKVTSRFAGRIEKLRVAVTGQSVKKGEPLFDIHSPELYAAERELLLAAQAMRSPGAASDSNRLLMLDATMERLHLHFGMTMEQIHAVADSGRPDDTVAFYSPINGTVMARYIQEGQYVEEGSALYDIADLSRVWTYLDVYEKDLRFVKIGTPVTVRTEAWPGETFSGTVTFVDPVVNSATRTVRVRSEFSNAEGKLKPQMYVRAQLRVPSPGTLVVPASAVMYTGKRNIVWVEVAENAFEPREVRVGAARGTLVEIAAGLEEGESVVTSGGYLLESESQLRLPAAGTGERDQ
jgi:Cu(I)/Ag(I) efflux system membrane fusion protein